MLLHPSCTPSAPQRCRQAVPTTDRSGQDFPPAPATDVSSLPSVSMQPRSFLRPQTWHSSASKPCHSLCAELCFTRTLPPPLSQVPAWRVSALILPWLPFAASPESQGHSPSLWFALILRMHTTPHPNTPPCL